MGQFRKQLKTNFFRSNFFFFFFWPRLYQSIYYFGMADELLIGVPRQCLGTTVLSDCCFKVKYFEQPSISLGVRCETAELKQATILVILGVSLPITYYSALQLSTDLWIFFGFFCRLKNINEQWLWYFNDFRNCTWFTWLKLKIRRNDNETPWELLKLK